MKPGISRDGSKNKTVLVGVLKSKRDLDILLNKNWYRIPVIYAPKKSFGYLAFYQPAVFGRQGKRIRYYARVLNRQTAKRNKLIPDELNHPRANSDYFRIYVSEIKKLPHPVRNTTPRRVSFGFTTLKRLLMSKDILQLYNVVPTERIVAKGLKQAGIKVFPQYRISKNNKRYCLDFAVFCKKGKIVIECNNQKAHAGSLQIRKDRIKDTFLKRNSWTVIRLTEGKIVFDLKGCLLRIERTIQKLGGFLSIGYL